MCESNLYFYKDILFFPDFLEDKSRIWPFQRDDPQIMKHYLLIEVINYDVSNKMYMFTTQIDRESEITPWKTWNLKWHKAKQYILHSVEILWMF